jgi:NAD(P)-dependent dehydrogenase (short-subunit alcohol dehydrogenase family)
MAGVSASMEGRVCVVTGATSGIGRITAIELARRGATVAVVGRDRERGEETRSAIRDATGTDRATLHLGDLSSQADVRTVADDLLARYEQMHVLVNNAGVVNLKRTTTVDGIEATFAVNHLAYFLLTHLLLPRLRQSGGARIVNVASDAHRFGGLNFDDLQNERRYRSLRVYGQSKLCNILFTRELARRVPANEVTVNCVHPGAVATRLGQNNGWWAVLITKTLSPFFRSPAQGAETSVYVATSPDVAGVSGRYFANCRAVEPSRAARDDAAAARLWQMSEALTAISARASG